MSNSCLRTVARLIRRCGLPLLLLLLSGCAAERVLMPTPHVYSEGHAQLFGELNPELRVSTVPVFFVTDRTPERGDDGSLSYGVGRSSSIAYGQATVEIGENLSWDAVRVASETRERDARVPLKMVSVEELGRTPPTPFPYTARGGFFDYDKEVLIRANRAGAAFQAEISDRLALTSRKELLIFVHGYNNTFDDAALTLAEMWHFFGREGVPVLYSWPAGRGGLLGYAYDRESGEFTVFHLKMMLRALADNPDVSAINLIAHSRGTDVTTSALRELFIESRAAGVDPLDRYRIKNLVLAAPDLDFDVVQQRLSTEPIGPGVGATDVYISPGDKALGIAAWLFGSARRIGRLDFSKLRGVERSFFEHENAANVIELRGDGGEFGHSYFHDNPAVSSDIFLALRFSREPGERTGRPLQRKDGSFFLIEDDYLLAP